jgi:NAD(P)-dependent dehydrogenase (short-subunit alcohol dehydrogenase family)
METLEGRVAVVTGGASGSGSRSRVLAERMKVVIADVEAGALEAACGELGASGEVIGVDTDVTDPRRSTAWPSVRSVRRARAVQQRRCRCAFCDGVGDHRERLALGARRQRDGRRPRHPGVRTAHDRGRGTGYVVNTSSVMAASRRCRRRPCTCDEAAVTSLTECLAMQFLSEGTNLRAGIFIRRADCCAPACGRPIATGRRPRAAVRAPRHDDQKLEAMAKQGGHGEVPGSTSSRRSSSTASRRALHHDDRGRVDRGTMRPASAFEQGELPEQRGVLG